MGRKASEVKGFGKLFRNDVLGDEATLFELLQGVWVHRMQVVSAKWKRILPFGDYIVDRWKRAEALKFGEGASIYDSALVFGKVKVGKNTWIGPHVILDGSGGLTIGDHCSISAGVQIYSHDSVQWAVSGGKSPYDYSPTAIGDKCYIGPNVVVVKGVTIGDRCIIGANSLVLEDIPSDSNAVGSPCRVRGST